MLVLVFENSSLWLRDLKATDMELHVLMSEQVQTLQVRSRVPGRERCSQPLPVRLPA